VNNLYIITVYKLHNKLCCVSSESRRTLRVERDECVEPCLFQHGGRRRSSACVYSL